MNKDYSRILSIIYNDETTMFSLNKLLEKLQIPKNKKFELQKNLDILCDKNYISKNMNGDYIRSQDKYIIIGTFRGSQKGFGFISSIDFEEDFYVYNSNTNGAIDGDLVLGKIIRNSNGAKKAEACVEEIIEETSIPLVGVFTAYDHFGFVVLDNPKIPNDVFVDISNFNNAKTDDKVIVKLIKRANSNKNMEGKIVSIIGNKNDAGVDISSIALKNQIELDFPQSVIEEIESIPTEVCISDTYGRLDLTKKTIITIDGEDAKDLDDAISIEKLPNGNFYLGVHIADVSHYVRENTALDEEAQKRATSVYLVDRVIPMLPRKLSNGICSLNPKVLRLTLSCHMEIDSCGNVVKSNIDESFIKTTERMTYSDVQAIFDKDEQLLEKYKNIVPMLEMAKELSSILIDKRDKRGAIDFNFPETKVILNESGKPIEIKPYDRNSATRLIEEFMIVCNETVCEYCSDLKLPFVYRVHENPDTEKLSRFRIFLSAYNYAIKGSTNPKTLQTIIKDIQGKPEEFAINQMMLRSLSKAKYSSVNLKHFGLASDFYCHFTSPIRRYPDLQIHRIIKKYLSGELYDTNYKNWIKIVEKVAKNSSSKEQNAAEAERDSVRLKETEFMSDKIGTEFECIISGITENKVFVQLPNTIEGVIQVYSLPDMEYTFDEQFLILKSDFSEQVFKLGDKILAKLVSTDIDKRSIEFKFVSKL